MASDFEVKQTKIEGGAAPLVSWVRPRQVVRPIAVRIRTLADLFIIYFRALAVKRNNDNIGNKRHTSGAPQSYLEGKSKELKFS